MRQGPPATELLLESQEGLYELLIMGRQPESPLPAAGGLNDLARQVLMTVEIPVLLVPTARPKIERLLICTAGGEPGKSDVHFGGRLARRSGAQVTVLHVRPAALSPAGQKRAEQHILNAQRSLEALGVSSQTKMVVGAPVEKIVHEAEAGDYDLVVIGAPAPRVPYQLLWRDFAGQVVSASPRPVLVVPMAE